MKLSQLEKLVSELRADATVGGIADPNVDFWETDLIFPQSRDYDLDESAKDVNLHRVWCDDLPSNGTRKKGDYSLPLVRIERRPQEQPRDRSIFTSWEVWADAAIRKEYAIRVIAKTKHNVFSKAVDKQGEARGYFNNWEPSSGHSPCGELE